MVLTRATTCAKAAAASMALFALFLIFGLSEVAGVATYLAVLMGVGAALSAVAAYRLWTRGSWDGRVLALGVTLGAFAARGLHLTVGLPGASDLGRDVSATGWLVFAMQVTTLALLAADASPKARTPEVSHPYAL